MQRIKTVVATTFLVVTCLSASFVIAQTRTNSQIKQERLSQVKDKQRIFVDIANETTKRQVKDFLSHNIKFKVVEDSKDAEIIYAATFKVESRPAFGIVENRTALPKLSSGESSGQQKGDAQFYKNEYEYRRKTSACVYYDEPNGNRVILWSKETLRITKSTESGSILEYFRKSGDELLLAKEFVKAIKSLK